MALKRIEACKTEADGVKAIINLGLEKFPIPGEPGFPLGGLFTAPQTKDEGGRQSISIYISDHLGCQAKFTKRSCEAEESVDAVYFVEVNGSEMVPFSTSPLLPGFETCH